MRTTASNPRIEEGMESSYEDDGDDDVDDDDDDGDDDDDDEYSRRRIPAVFVLGFTHGPDTRALHTRCLDHSSLHTGLTYEVPRS